MSKIIAIINQKGGVGKTTTTISLCSFLAAMGKKTLIVDIDPQGNASSGLGLNKSKLEHSIYDVLIGDCNGNEAINKTRVENLDIIASNIDLAGAEVEMVNLPGREKILKQALTPLRNHYDYIFIDCPPSLALLSVNALTASDSILVPIQSEFFALEGLSQLMNTFKLCKHHLNPQLEVEGVILTMYDNRSTLASGVASEILRYFRSKVFKTRIPRNIKLAEAPSHGLSILQYEPKSNGGLAYKALAEEFLDRNKDKYTAIPNLNLFKVKG